MSFNFSITWFVLAFGSLLQGSLTWSIGVFYTLTPRKTVPPGNLMLCPLTSPLGVKFLLRGRRSTVVPVVPDPAQ